VGLLAAPIVANAQDLRQSPVLTLNQDRLYVSSEFGRRVQSELEQASQDLATENRRIETALVEEERRLTEERPGMEPAAFREVAEEFDIRVTAIRRAQDNKRAAIQRRADQERARFFDLAFPVLLRLVEESGAVAILNNSAVIFSVRQIDITEAAIERINAEIGPSQTPSGTTPVPRPDPEPNSEN
jgi:Skp family chaperone for outer membrane proteins